MNVTSVAPPRRSLTEAAFRAEAIARFGPNPRSWRFECPGCRDVATAEDFPPGQADLVGAECVGRHVPGRGCRRTANGALPGPWLLRRDDGAVIGVFPFADALSGALGAVQEIGETGGPARAEAPSAPPMAPPRALSVERGHPGTRKAHPDIPCVQLLDLENWDYRVALTAHQSLLGYADADPDVPLITAFIDTASGPYDWCHYLRDGIESALEHIAQHELPITRHDLDTAQALIRAAYGEDHPAAPAAPEQRPYWTAEEGWTNSIGCSCHLAAPCSRCESLQDCERCEHDASVPEDDMAAHLAEVHGETSKSEA